MSRRTVHDLLADARSKIKRLHPTELREQLVAPHPPLLIDIRDAADRAAEGVVTRAIHIPLSVLLWRVDPTAELTDPRANDQNQPIVLICSDGFSSSWAGAAMVDIGFTNVADVIGGYRAWNSP